jgi:4-alpha-glucanotransferase
MLILQFAFDSAEAGARPGVNSYLPHNHRYNAVVYTGTHDNTTTLAWYKERTHEEKDLIRRYVARPDTEIVWDLIRLAMASVARYAIIPFQDVLNLDSDARMNTPSVMGGNWAWRYRPEALNAWVSTRLGELVELFGRDPAMWAAEAKAKAEAAAKEKAKAEAKKKAKEKMLAKKKAKA